jgi:Transposase IS66 family
VRTGGRVTPSLGLIPIFADHNCTRQWPKLVLFLDHGEVPIHNNFVERQIKKYALGRKLWMFATTRLVPRPVLTCSPLL